MTFLLGWTTRPSVAVEKMRDSERRTESTRQRGLSTRQRGGVTKERLPRDVREKRRDVGRRKLANFFDTPGQSYRRYSRIFWTEKTAYKLTVGVTDVKVMTRHVCRDSTWYMTPQRKKHPRRWMFSWASAATASRNVAATTWTKITAASRMQNKNVAITRLC